MSTPPYSSSDGIQETGTYDCELIREIRAFCLGRTHLNPLGSPTQVSLRNKKLAAIKPLSYVDAINAIRLARREGAKRGIGSQMAAAMANAILRDSLGPDETPDIIAVPADESGSRVLRSPEVQELTFARSQTELHAALITCAADGVIDEKERGTLRRLKAREDREFNDVLVALVQNGVRR
jgi:hypothetical protein